MQSDNPQQDPTQALLKILKGDTKDLHVPQKTIVTGKKIRNSVMRKFVEKYRSLNKISEKELLDVILAFDEVAEKESLTDEILDQIRRDPSVLSKLKTKK